MQKLTIMDDAIAISAVLERPDTQPGPLVLVLHGFTSNKEKGHTLAACRAMHEAGFATLRFDLYGHGETGGSFRDHTLYKWISNTLAVLEYARGLDFVTDVYLSGHSQGGLTAALVAGMAPDLIQGLILRAPAFMIPRGARDGCLLGFHFDPLRVPDEVEIASGVMLGGNYIRTAQTLHVEEAMDRFSGPVLIVHGDADDVVPPEDSVTAAARYRHAQLCMIHGETHHYNIFPEKTEACIREWLQALPGKA
ncbi:MAG: alpha/beta fold hydrolase [Clostridia bacterium]|nr:alpha/beta fold hydrolase [Clostridia bacterium]